MLEYLQCRSLSITIFDGYMSPQLQHFEELDHKRVNPAMIMAIIKAGQEAAQESAKSQGPGAAAGWNTHFFEIPWKDPAGRTGLRGARSR